MFDIKKDYPKTPLHPNCRSCIVPVVDGWNPSRKRENVKGEDGKKPITEYKSYEEWVKDK